MKTFAFLYFIGIGFIIYCCTPKSTTAVIISEKTKNIDLLEDYSSYAWIPVDADFEEIAIEAVEEQLHVRGYHLDTEKPDFLVALHIINEPTDELVRTPLYSNLDYRGPDYYSSPFQNHYFNDIITVPIVSNYTDDELNYVAGTVVIDIIDRSKMEIIWRGWAEDQRNHVLDVVNDLPGYIVQVFEKFPLEPKE